MLRFETQRSKRLDAVDSHATLPAPLVQSSNYLQPMRSNVRNDLRRPASRIPATAKDLLGLCTAKCVFINWMTKHVD